MHRSDNQADALNSLRDISDYSNYIEEKITKLNHLYRSLNIDSNKETASLGLNRSRILTNGEREGRTLYRTAQHPFYSVHAARPQQSLMYRTEYLPKKSRYQADKTDSMDLKSLSLSRKKSLINKKWRYEKQQKLKMYQTIKTGLLDTFYVGGTIADKLKNEEWNRRRQNQQKRRGRIWHGRPPVKIIEQFN